MKITNMFKRKIIIDYGAMLKGKPVGIGNTGMTTKPTFGKTLTQEIPIDKFHVWSVNGTTVITLENSKVKGNYIRIDIRNY